MSNTALPTEERNGASSPADGVDTLSAQGLSVSLTVKDAEQSATWYRDVVGFTETNRYQRDGRLAGVAMSAGPIRILLNQDDGAKGMDRVKGEGFSMMITTSGDIDALARRMTDRGATLVTQPTDMPWGVRAFRAVDPDGYRIAFSTERKSLQ